MSQVSQIPFLVETDRVLEILSKQIYDSPYAMVRENLQNAYDAVLMRARKEGKSLKELAIIVTASPEQLTIQDDGIGMSEEVLRNNFWRAGSSGKNTEEARAAGVIGTFGIGAMANFGVCSQLSVETREAGSDISIRTFARKQDLNIGADCIQMELGDESIVEGTKVIAAIDPAHKIELNALRNYVQPFVRFLEVPVILNDSPLSGEDPSKALGITEQWTSLGGTQVVVGRVCLDIDVWSDGDQLAVISRNVKVEGIASFGALWLRHQVGQLFGLRSRFGLAPIPVSGIYQLGGFADLPFLYPTAGREALTRESIQEVSALIASIELALTQIVKNTSLADKMPAFQQHLLQLNQPAWAVRVKIQVQSAEKPEELGLLSERYAGHQLQWYAGSDPDTILTFTSDEYPLIRVSQSNPRREVQIRFLREVLKLEPIPDTASIIERYPPSALSWHEVGLMLAIVRTLKSDYLIEDVDIQWVKISHGVPLLVESAGEKLTISISRAWPALQAVAKIVEQSPEVLDGFAKDFVREHIYARIQSFVPSSQRVGLDALRRTLERKKELYRLAPEDRGDLEPILADYLAGKVNFGEVLTVAAHAVSGQTQRVTRENVGTVENVLADVVQTASPPGDTQGIAAPTPGAPILRPGTFIQERLLIASRDISHLNNYRLFLALSDRVFQLERDFFLWPHSTQLAWAGRRIVYVLALANARQSLYYDIELRGSRTSGGAGGKAMQTTTIVSNNRIFIPVPPELSGCFNVDTSPMEFFVRFDLLTH